MTLQDIEAYCLHKPGAYLDYPFGPEFCVIKLKASSQDKGRIFAQPFILRGEPKVTLNCTPMTGELYRGLYPESVTRGYHCPPVQQPHFNTVALDGSVPDEMLKEMMDHAYSTVLGKLTKKHQKEIKAISSNVRAANW